MSKLRFPNYFSVLMVLLVHSLVGLAQVTNQPQTPAQPLTQPTAATQTTVYEKTSLDAPRLAREYYNAIVKILLIDSTAEKAKPGSGYLGRGSGFIVSADGYVFTNKHVIDNAIGFMGYTYFDPSDEELHQDRDIYTYKSLKDLAYYKVNYVSRATPIIQIYTDRNGGYKLYHAHIVAIDSLNFDGAILKIDADLSGAPLTANFHPCPIGNSDESQQGEDLCVFGFPAQYEAGYDLMLKDQSTLTFGKNSGNDFVYNTQYGFIKTDAAINGGNSGGPVFNQSNKVIGLASKTIDKTKTGLIGGINAMYHLSAMVPELHKQLVSQGLVAPAKQLPNQTTTLYKPLQLPSNKEMFFSNTNKNLQRRLKGGCWYLRFPIAVGQQDAFSLQPSVNHAVTNPIGDINVATPRQFGFEIGRMFSLWRIDNDQKLSIDWTIFKYTTGLMNWQNSALNTKQFQDSNFTSSFSPNARYHRLATGLGLAYSRILFKCVNIDVYYKLLYGLESDNLGVSNEYIGSVSSPGNAGTPASTSNIYYFSDPFVLNTFGFNVRRWGLLVGLEYSQGRMPLTYLVPANTGTFAVGYRAVNSINLMVGFALNSRARWMQMVTSAYDE